jgi:transposase
MTTIQERTRIIELSALGMKAPEIAAQLACSVWTVRKWKQRFKKKGTVCSKMGRPSRECLKGFDQRVGDKIISLRIAHPGWGPETLKVELEQDAGLKMLRIPQPSTIALFLKKK